MVGLNCLEPGQVQPVHDHADQDKFYLARQTIDELVLDRETLHYKQQVGLKYADLVYNGQWFTPLREALDGFVNVTQRNVTGRARFKLYKGSAILVGRQSPHSLYREDYATFDEDDVYNQKDAEGFIKLFGLPMKVEAMIEIEGTGVSKYRQPDYSSSSRIDGLRYRSFPE